MLRRLILFAIFAFALLMGMSYLVTSRIEIKPGTIAYRLLVPQEWRKNRIDEFAQATGYESIPEEGTSPAALKIEVLHAQADLFITYMLAQGYKREIPEASSKTTEQATPPLTTWIKVKESERKDFVQTDIESPCDSTEACKRTLLILQNSDSNGIQ